MFPNKIQFCLIKRNNNFAKNGIEYALNTKIDYDWWAVTTF